MRLKLSKGLFKVSLLTVVLTSFTIIYYLFIIIIKYSVTLTIQDLISSSVHHQKCQHCFTEQVSEWVNNGQLLIIHSLGSVHPECVFDVSMHVCRSVCAKDNLWVTSDLRSICMND